MLNALRAHRSIRIVRMFSGVCNGQPSSEIAGVVKVGKNARTLRSNKINRLAPKHACRQACRQERLSDKIYNHSIFLVLIIAIHRYAFGAC